MKEREAAEAKKAGGSYTSSYALSKLPSLKIFVFVLILHYKMYHIWKSTTRRSMIFCGLVIKICPFVRMQTSKGHAIMKNLANIY